ncbi:hypothetical protein IWQ57_003108 [Coemansia nantahalensis]|uniref:Uncharacterized protein n=1 Tax=Coemansia nantahalensis TaxID=2789366 RepID=A0ACC1JXI2_9FUNG|nr:hypothetical protein IWQ57_003108 [Coemansia nantahalensis]
MGTGCPPPNGNTARDKRHTGPRFGNHPIIGLVRCGGCALADMMREAELAGASGIVVTNTDECGQPTKEFLESTTSVRVPVTFVTNRVAEEIRALQQQAAATAAELSRPPRGARRHSFVYMSIRDEHAHGPASMATRIVASAHLLLAAVALAALVVYTVLACSIGSLRYIPRELAPGFFARRPAPVDKDVLAQLPLVPAAWGVATRGCGGDDDDEKESASCQPATPAEQALQQQLADIIVRSGCGSYSFTEETRCAICLDGYVRNAPLRVLPCRHAFHRECVDTWLLSDAGAAHCPVCKTGVADGLQFLERHGYGEVLDARSAGSPAQSLPPAAADSRSRAMLPLYYFRLARRGLAALWRSNPE